MGYGDLFSPGSFIINGFIINSNQVNLSYSVKLNMKQLKFSWGGAHKPPYYVPYLRPSIEWRLILYASIYNEN